MRILITGCARSGTSLTSQICGALGANLGKVNGLYENTPIREGILKPMIEAVGGDPLGQYPLPPMDADPKWDIREQVEAELGRDDWAYKGVKMLLVWRNWVREFPDAKWVIVRRDVDDIADSCVRAGFMRAFDNRKAWATWANHYIDRIGHLKREVNSIEVWPHRAVGGDLSGYQRMAEFCGLEWDEQAARNIIEPRKWHAPSS